MRKCDRSWSGRFKAIRAATVTRLRSRFDKSGRSQTSSVQHVVSDLRQLGRKVAHGCLRWPGPRAGICRLPSERYAILGIADLLHPFDDLAVQLLANGDVRH